MHGLMTGRAASWDDANDWATAVDESVMIKARIGGVDAADDRRRADRQPVEIDAKLRELGSMGTEARVLNLSETGFMAASMDVFEVGARVWLMLPGRDRANAVVRWVAAGKIGAEFAEPLPADALPQR